MAALVRQLRCLAHETGSAVVLVHHTRKTGGEDGLGLRGSSAIAGGTAGHIGFQGKPSKATLAVCLRSEPGRAIDMRMDDVLHWHVVEGGADLDSRILSALRDGNPMTYADLEKALRTARGTLTNHLPDLVAQGRVVDAGKRGLAKLFTVPDEPDGEG